MTRKRRPRGTGNGFIDQDYKKELPEGEREWLDKFNSEYYEGNFSQDNFNNIHRKHEYKTEAYVRDNAAQRDFYSKTRGKYSEKDKRDPHIHNTPVASHLVPDTMITQPHAISRSLETIGGDPVKVYTDNSSSRQLEKLCEMVDKGMTDTFIDRVVSEEHSWKSSPSPKIRGFWKSQQRGYRGRS